MVTTIKITCDGVFIQSNSFLTTSFSSNSMTHLNRTNEYNENRNRQQDGINGMGTPSSNANANINTSAILISNKTNYDQTDSSYRKGRLSETNCNVANRICLIDRFTKNTRPLSRSSSVILLPQLDGNNNNNCNSISLTSGNRSATSARRCLARRVSITDVHFRDPQSQLAEKVFNTRQYRPLVYCNRRNNNQNQNIATASLNGVNKTYGTLTDKINGNQTNG